MTLGSSQTSPYHCPPFFFQLVPPILVVPKSITLSNSHAQGPFVGMNDQIVQRPWEKRPPQSPLNMDDPMDGE
jgi:hypothetical protein